MAFLNDLHVEQMRKIPNVFDHAMKWMIETDARKFIQSSWHELCFGHYHGAPKLDKNLNAFLEKFIFYNADITLLTLKHLQNIKAANNPATNKQLQAFNDALEVFYLHQNASHMKY